VLNAKFYSSEKRRKLIEAISFATRKDVNIPLRKWRRSKIDVRVKVRCLEEPDNPVVVVRSYALSEGGMSVYAPGSLEVGTSVLVEFWLPGTARDLRLPAVIRNRCGFRRGMEFTELAVADRMLIRDYLRHREARNDNER
jgi:c-di-GMP-binding flagellar brake protein YcgR